MKKCFYYFFNSCAVYADGCAAYAVGYKIKAISASNQIEVEVEAELGNRACDNEIDDKKL